MSAIVPGTGNPVPIQNATNLLNNIMMQETPVDTDELVAQQEQPFPKQSRRQTPLSA
jgi:hypothetical protein